MSAAGDWRPVSDETPCGMWLWGRGPAGGRAGFVCMRTVFGDGAEIWVRRVGPHGAPMPIARPHEWRLLTVEEAG